MFVLECESIKSAVKTIGLSVHFHWHFRDREEIVKEAAKRLLERGDFSNTPAQLWLEMVVKYGLHYFSAAMRMAESSDARNGHTNKASCP